MKKFPIGISTLSEILNGGYYYVDKTPLVRQMTEEGKYFFICRPRRFGKSLFIDTLKEAFEGNRALFKGLYLENNWDWSEKYPVVHISFGGGVIKNRVELENKISEIFIEHQNTYSIKLQSTGSAGKFRELILQLADKFKRNVVILVDEYDKPILDNITDLEIAKEVREGLKNLYSIIKDCDAHVKFCLLTGVTKFSKVSLFSGLNNLKDLTLDVRYATICGYTQTDVKHVFAECLEGVDLEELKRWYNGYNFMGEPVYNPFDVLLYLDSREYKNYWFETATPGFLMELMLTKRFYLPALKHLETGESLIGSFDVDKLYLETIMFQTGYLTIDSVRRMGGLLRYKLKYPNFEVETSFSDYMLNYLVEDAARKGHIQSNLYDAVTQNQPEDFKSIFHSFFASIPNDWYRKNSIAKYEGYYASIFYSYFVSLGFEVIPEDTTNHGRIDMTVKHENRVYIFEFKVIELIKEKNSALQQIQQKAYHEKYLAEAESLHLIGVEFSSEEKNIVSFEIQRVKSLKK